ncbi:MAG TPA: carbonic anhydrase family protein [Gemmatimonadaceae bacterium]|nr:carbonic anhydrase family protein [Gemmatimonadaceae bacterium]
MRCLIVALFIVPAVAHSQWKTPWSYEGPRGYAHWGDLDPDYATCKTGQAQSPIDIRSTEKADVAPIRFEYTSAPLKYLINNGYTIRVNYHDTSSFFVVGDKRYHLTQFHFHRPSEEYIHGKPYAMELHLMHTASDGAIAGVAVMIASGAANETVQRLWDHMPKVKGSEQEIPGVAIDPSGLIPGDLSYYLYTGSISAPPCTEGVLWYVLETPITLSPAQIAAFAELYPHDVRPLQPLNGRVVKESR